MPAQNQCGMGTIQGCEHWEVWFIGDHLWKLATTKHILSPNSNSLCFSAATTGRICGNGDDGGGGMYGSEVERISWMCN